MPYDPEKKVFESRMPADLYEAGMMIMGLSQALQQTLLDLTVARGVKDISWLDRLQAEVLREIKSNITTEDVSIERQAEAGKLTIEFVENLFNQIRREIAEL